MKTVNSFIKEYLIYIVEFIIFFVWLCLIPPICDRYMEAEIGNIEGLFRYCFAQVRWVEKVNGRALSNIFSYLVDGNVLYIRAFVDSMLITTGSVLVYKIAEKKDGEYKSLAKILSALAFFVVDWEIREEVYFYATTLYVSAFVIITAAVYLCKINETKGLTEREKKMLYIFTFIGSVWLENCSIVLCALYGVLCLYKGILKEKIMIYIKALAISIIGFILMFGSSMFGSMGRLNYYSSVWRFSLRSSIDRSREILLNNNSIFLVLSFVMILVIITNRQKIKKSWIVSAFLWGIQCVFSVLFAIRQVYMFGAVDPVNVEYAEEVYGWENFSDVTLDKIFGFIERIYVYIFPVLCFLLLVFSIYLFLRLKNAVLIAVVCIFFSGLLIDVLGLQQGARICSLSIFQMIGLIAILVMEIQPISASVGKIIQAMKIVFVVASAFVVELDTEFVKQQYIVEQQRFEIADNVRVRQRMEEWDYNKYVVFPKYTPNGIGRAMLGEIRTNPSHEDIYYDHFLQYYGLDDKTKVIFSNQDTYILVLWERNGGKNAMAELVMPLVHENVTYDFVISDGQTVVSYISDLDEPRCTIEMDKVQFDRYSFGIIIRDKEGNIIENIEMLEKCYWIE